MPLSAGTKLGLYEIVALIGKGGMGEVYRARDTKLKRDVAMKVLPEAFARDPDRMARFQREAEVLASLDHPNIGHIYGIVESNGSHALVLALIEGPTLEDRVAAGPIAIEEAVAIARQVAEALEYAHERGVIHRDLKPANIKVNSDGAVKVLDFGLAKVLEDEPPAAASIANSPTLTLGHTRAGLILGTAPYMSPEQAVGRPVDRRSDIFSFGAVLYEMLTGQRAFAGLTSPDVLEAIVKGDADWAELPAQVSPTIQKLLRRCLVKDRKQRLQAIGEARIALENPGKETALSEQPALQDPARQRWFWLAATAVLSVATLALGLVAYRHSTEQSPIAERLSMLMPEKMGFDSPLTLPAVSPDGRRIALVLLDGRQRSSLWVRDLDGLNARILPGTEGASYPFWSPDSRSLGFFADGKLKKIGAAGGAVRTVCEAFGRGGTWNQDDIIVYGTALAGLFRVSAEGGTPVALSVLDRAAGENNHRTPWFLPDGKHFLYTSRNLNGSKTRVYVDSIDANPGSRTRREVLAADTNVVYVPSIVPSLAFSEKGYLLFVRDRTLIAQPFDPASPQTTGEAVPVADQVDFFSDFSQGQFSASRNGTLIYTSGATAAASSQLTWFDRGGKPIGNVGKPADILGPRISPDGSAVATDPADSGGARDIWLHDLVRGTSSRLTLGPGLNQFPVWSPDGSRIIYYSATVDFYPHVKPTNRTGAEEILNKDARGNSVTDWSRDGRYVIANVRNRDTRTVGIWVIPQFGDRKPFSYINTQFREGSARLSPDGQWLAYVSDESKRTEVYVETFPEHGGKWQISTSGGEWPVWNHDGRELYFIGPDHKLVAVEVKVSGKGFQAGIPKLLFEIPVLTGQTAFGGAVFGVGAPFDVGKDGRFLVQVPVRQDSTNAPPTVVLNWQAGLKK